MGLKFWGPRPDGRPRFIWAERWNMPIYAVMIAAGVPLMGLLIHDEGLKWKIAAVWFAIGFPLIVFFEGRELTGQMSGRGALNADQATRQIGSAQFPYWGAVIAIVVWGIGIAAHWSTDPWATPIKYGVVEWGLIVHTLYVTRINNKVFYGLIIDLLKATPRAERTERRMPPGGG